MPNSALVNLRRSNKAAVLYNLMSHGEMSRLALSKELGLTTSSLTHIVNELLQEKMVEEVSEVATGKRGRKEILLRFNCLNHIAIGINIESDNTHITAASYNTILSEEIISTSELLKDNIDSLSIKIKDLISRFSDYQILGICVGICGYVDSDNGISVNSFGILPDMYNLSKCLENKLNTKVTIVNNIRAQATSLITENHKNFLYIKHSPGIGCAIIDDGHAVDGVDGIAGELGHTTVSPDGLQCRCGKKGCLEAYASETSIVDQYYNETGIKKNIHEIYSLYDKDVAASKILNLASNYIAMSISNASTVLNPERIILTGGIFFDEKLCNIIKEKIKKFGCNKQIDLLSDEYKIKAFAEARYILMQKLFEVKNEKEN